jgi:hypothetical protein
VEEVVVSEEALVEGAEVSVTEAKDSVVVEAEVSVGAGETEAVSVDAGEAMAAEVTSEAAVGSEADGMTLAEDTGLYFSS